MNTTNFTCKIRNEETKYNSWNLFYRWHIKVHHEGILPKNYYDSFYKLDSEGTCDVCAEPTNFSKFGSGYSRFCSNKCIGKSESVNDKKKKDSEEKLFRKR